MTIKDKGSIAISTEAIELKFPRGYNSQKKTRVAAGLALLSGDKVEFIDTPHTDKICPEQIERYSTYSLLDVIIPRPGK